MPRIFVFSAKKCTLNFDPMKANHSLICFQNKHTSLLIFSEYGKAGSSFEFKNS